GPSGVGKTTIGRIIAKEVGCKSFDLIEVDGASTTGIDAMRELTTHLLYKSVGGSPRAVIVDECHAVSAQAFKSLLKILEEPPENVYWILCTTQLSKVPKEVRTRCLDYVLKPVSLPNIQNLIADIAKAERLPIRKSAEALKEITEAAEGSPRLALSMLARCGHLKDEDEVRALCTGEVGTSKEAIDLSRMLIKKASWKEIVKCIKGIDSSPESVRIIVLRYMSAILMNNNSTQLCLAILDAFSEPFNDREGKAPILLACAQLHFGEEEE
ncbi:hypothetical protein LCGC14_3003270, partial [marine sediment metagenome]